MESGVGELVLVCVCVCVQGVGQLYVHRVGDIGELMWVHRYMCEWDWMGELVLMCGVLMMCGWWKWYVRVSDCVQQYG